MSDTVGTVLEIQRMSTEDGPGLRTTVFVKGCSLACSWCHNPESIHPAPQVVWHREKCIACRTCVDACPQRARALDERGAHVDAARCVDCGTCRDDCPTLAIEQLGQPWSVDALVAEVLKDRTFFETSGGGVTLSGGEPVLQPRFAAAFLTAIREAGVHTALDTCGLCNTEALLDVSASADLVLYDLKEIDPAKHEAFTAHGNAKILENLLTLAEALRGRPRTALWIRTPVIPGATATRENLEGIGALIARDLADVVERWELCAFNNLCENKYQRLGLEWRHAETPLLGRDELEALAEIARGSGVRPEIVLADGPTALPEADVVPLHPARSPCLTTD